MQAKILEYGDSAIAALRLLIERRADNFTYGNTTKRIAFGRLHECRTAAVAETRHSFELLRRTPIDAGVIEKNAKTAIHLSETVARSPKFAVVMITPGQPLPRVAPS